MHDASNATIDRRNVPSPIPTSLMHDECEAAQRQREHAALPARDGDVLLLGVHSEPHPSWVIDMETCGLSLTPRTLPKLPRLGLNQSRRLLVFVPGSRLRAHARLLDARWTQIRLSSSVRLPALFGTPAIRLDPEPWRASYVSGEGIPAYSRTSWCGIARTTVSATMTKRPAREAFSARCRKSDSLLRMPRGVTISNIGPEISI